MAERFDEIYPSHGTCPVKPDIIGKLYAASEEIIDGRIEGRDGELFGSPIWIYDAGTAKFICDR